ncbi:hypothetical protein BY996DRAFT_6511730 [Phakopsora pachyrhizi]|nr:hypothetical protein BY996DRAFT_6511730 [Phakopsora pachyrhizi]
MLVNLFLENSEVTENTFTTLAEVADSPEKFHKSSKYEIELISCFVNQALTYFQLYAPTEVNAGLKNILKALEEEEGRIKTGNEKLSEETLKKFSIVDRVSLKRAFKFKAKVRQLSNFVNLIPAVYSKDICEWLQLPKQEKLLDSIRSRALFLNKEIEILANLKNQLRGKE